MDLSGLAVGAQHFAALDNALLQSLRRSIRVESRQRASLIDFRAKMLKAFSGPMQKDHLHGL
jgi:hypothetical protein